MSTNESPSFAKPVIDINAALQQHPPGPGFELSDPNDPPWGVSQAFLTFAASVLLLFFLPILTALPYAFYKIWVFGSRPEMLAGDKNFIFFSLLGMIPSHVLSFLVVWLVVTNRGRRPFWKNLAWSWPENLGPWESAALALGLPLLLLFIGLLITHFVGGSETELDKLINSSYRARLITAFLAVVTGPLVEESIYRGVLYSALQRAIGMLWAVIIVSLLFAGVHVLQYFNNFGVIAVIGILSVSLTLVRASTGRLLPSFVMHVVFNGVQALILILQPFVEKHGSEQQAAAGFLIKSLSRFLG